MHKLNLTDKEMSSLRVMIDYLHDSEEKHYHEWHGEVHDHRDPVPDDEIIAKNKEHIFVHNLTVKRMLNREAG